MDHRTTSQEASPIGHQKPESAAPFAVVGPVELIRDVLCGPQQHNEHCKGWRWHMYVQDNEKRFQNVMAELRKMHAERRAHEEFQEAAE